MTQTAPDPRRKPAASQPQQIETILALLGQATDKFEPEALSAWQWMARRAADPAVGELLLHDLTITMARILDAIGQAEPVNGITIARLSGVPKGTVSKTTRRLASMGLINPETLPDNRKEILFRLTPLGREVFLLHREFDAEMQRGFERFLSRYDPDELGLMIRVLADLLDASFLDDAQD